MARLDTDRQEKLEPKRMAFSKSQIEGKGYVITYEDERKIQFEFKGKTVTYFPYSGWATGPTITDGRGLNKLLIQI